MYTAVILIPKYSALTTFVIIDKFITRCIAFESRWARICSGRGVILGCINSYQSVITWSLFNYTNELLIISPSKIMWMSESFFKFLFRIEQSKLFIIWVYWLLKLFWEITIHEPIYWIFLAYLYVVLMFLCKACLMSDWPYSIMFIQKMGVPCLAGLNKVCIYQCYVYLWMQNPH